MSDLPQHPLIDAVKPVLDMLGAQIIPVEDALISCLLYTSDAADE